MRMKSNKISIVSLNPVFTKSLQKFDLLHKQLMGNPAMVTSVDTGSHWGGLAKEDRPDGWEVMTEAEVRQFSCSKHYNIPCDALDLRRRNPDPENDKNTYFDDLTESQQRYFRTEIYECFPDHIFDIVFSRLCIHCEYDPNRPRLETVWGNDDIKLDGETKDNIKELMKGEIKPTKISQRKIVVTELDKMWAYLDRSAVVMGSINFLTKHLTGFGFFKDKLKDKSLGQRLIELIRTVINKVKGTKQ